MIKPQNVSIRYANSILTNGSNRLFRLMRLQTCATLVEGVNIGTHYSASVAGDTEDSLVGLGATPLAAVVNALTHWGVTFQ